MSIEFIPLIVCVLFFIGLCALEQERYLVTFFTFAVAVALFAWPFVVVNFCDNTIASTVEYEVKIFPDGRPYIVVDKDVVFIGRWFEENVNEGDIVVRQHFHQYYGGLYWYVPSKTNLKKSTDK